MDRGGLCLSHMSFMNDLRESNKLCDVVIQIDQHIYPAHSLVLSACSTLLQSLLSTVKLTEQPSATTISLQGYSRAAFELVLDFIYSGKTPPIENWAEFYDMYVKLQLRVKDPNSGDIVKPESLKDKLYPAQGVSTREQSITIKQVRVKEESMDVEIEDMGPTEFVTAEEEEVEDADDLADDDKDLSEVVSRINMKPGKKLSLTPREINQRKNKNWHLKPSRKKNPQPCPYCNSVLISMSKLKEHVKRNHPEHAPDRKECSVCGKSMLSKLYDQHFAYCMIGDVRDDQTYHCFVENCRFRSPSKRVVVTHYRESHTSDLNQSCPMCDYAIVGKRVAIYDHILHTHPEYDLSTLAEDPITIHTCEYCDFRSCSKQTLTTHRKLQHKEQMKADIECKYCKKSFATPSSLNFHIQRLHEAKKRNKFFQCDRCNRVSKSKDKIRQHQYTDHGMIPQQEFIFTCELCDFTSISEQLVKNHMTTDHPQDLHQCEICPKLFRTGRAYKQHLSEHEGVYMYKCEQCGFGCPSKQRLLKHMIELHSSTDVLQCQFEGCKGLFDSQLNYDDHLAKKHSIPTQFVVVNINEADENINM